MCLGWWACVAAAAAVVHALPQRQRLWWWMSGFCAVSAGSEEEKFITYWEGWCCSAALIISSHKCFLAVERKLSPLNFQFIVYSSSLALCCCYCLSAPGWYHVGREWTEVILNCIIKSSLFEFPSSQIPPCSPGRTSRRPISATRLTSAAWWTSTLLTRPWTKVRSTPHSRFINYITIPFKKKQIQKYA